MQRRHILLSALGAGLAAQAQTKAQAQAQAQAPTQAQTQPQAPLRDITIPVSSFSFATAAVRVAHSLGLFANNGLNARIVAMDSANAALSALIAGSAEVVVAGPGELIAAQARGQKVQLLVDVYRGFGASLVLAKAVAIRTGIDPAAPAALRLKALDGLLIASASATSSYTASYKGAAQAAGARIRFTYMTQPTMAVALETGAIQGMIASAPFWGLPVARGSGVLWLSGPKAELPPENMPASSTSIQVMQPFADANPKLMLQLVKTIRDLGELIATRPDVVKTAVAKLYPDVDAATMDVLFATESDRWNTRPMTTEDIRHEIDFMRSGGASMPGLDGIDPAAALYSPPR